AGSSQGEVRATWAMGCFWEGDAALGALSDVRSTRPGYGEGGEVVELTADSPQALERIAAFARKRGYRSAAGPVRASKADDKVQLNGTRFETLALTEGQRMRLNSALAAGTDPLIWLSPSQRRQLGASP